jgi:hypothetical protein
MKRFFSIFLLFISLKVAGQNVGIGTPTPDRLLHLKGDFEMLRIQGTQPWIGFMNNTDPGYVGFLFYPDTSMVVGTAAGSDRPVIVAPNNNFLVGAFPLNGGRVGIGTSAPDNKLHVSSSSTGDGLKITAPSPSVKLFENTSEIGFFKVNSSTVDVGTPSQVHDLNLQVGLNSIMRINKFGNIGVNSLPITGTVLKLESGSSNDVLRISGDDVPGISWFTQNINRAGIDLYRFGAFNSQYGVNISVTDPDASVRFISNGNTGMTVRPSLGSVVIGNTTTPGALNVNGETFLNGFTYLGSTAPAIKMITLSGTLPASGATVLVSTGLDPNKILAVDMHVNSALNFKTPPGSGISGYEYNYLIVGGNIEITPKAGNSTDVANRPVRILVTYEQ